MSLNELLDTVRRDLGDRLDVLLGEIAVGSFGRVVWPDTSLGCPQPGELYNQVLVPGYRIQLQVGSETYFYHADETGRMLLCEQPSADLPMIPIEPGEIDDAIPWMPVD